MSSQLEDLSGYSDSEKLLALQYLVDEGFVTFYQDENEEWFVRVADNVS